MTRFLLFISAVLFTLQVSGKDNGLLKFYVGTYTKLGAEGIYLCTFNPENGEIVLQSTFKAIDNPSFLKLSPDRQHLYAVSEISSANGKQGNVLAYNLDEKGLLHFLNKQPSNGDGPCHVDVSHDGKFVAITTYGSGTVSLYPVKDDGSLMLASTVFQNEGSGPNKDRQDGPHAHSIKFSPFTDEVFSADLGTDQLNIYHLADGKLLQEGQLFSKLPAGSGPRHFTFHPNGKNIFVINELASTVSMLKKKADRWDVVQTISTLPKGFKGENYCADIHLSPDGKFLYGSNRGHNSIAVFQIDEKDQTLEMLGNVSVEGDWPRNFSLTPDGNWLLVANQKSNNITVFKVNKENGTISYNGTQLQLPAPVCIEFY